MRWPEDFDIDRLLAPIAGDVPQGVDLREDYSARSPYSRMRDIRTEARDAERLLETHDAEQQPPDPKPMWRALHQIAVQLLTEQTKDLEVAAWLTEALVRSHGLAGLAAGSRLLTGLMDRYWDGIYPLPDDYGMETRVAPLVGLNGRTGSGTLIMPLLHLELFNRGDGTPVKLHQYQASAGLMSLDATARQQRLKAGAIPFEELEKDARTVGRPSLERLREPATEAAAAWDAMAAVVEAKAGDDAPAMSDVRRLLREVAELIARYAPAAPAKAGEAALAAPAAAGVDAPVSEQAVMTRESALRSLETLAAFFRRTEPHSPLSYTLDEAVRRARLPWLELLDEVIADRGSRDAFLTSLGIRPPVPPE